MCPLDRCQNTNVQRLWDRLINYTMGQLVIVGAVVEPDLAELLLWSCFTVVVGLIGIYSGPHPQHHRHPCTLCVPSILPCRTTSA